MTSRAILFLAPGQPLQRIERATPEPDCGELLVRILACTLCRSDLHTHAGRRIAPTPCVLGHEIVGRIEAIGPGPPPIGLDGRPATVGDRVAWSLAVACGECFFCTRDLPQKCTQLFKYGHEAVSPERPWSGGLADHIVLLPKTAWMPIPPELSDTIGALANCAGATAAAVLRAAQAAEGGSVILFGAGVLGAMACALASDAGVAQILVVDPLSACRDRALRFGAHSAFDAARPDLDEVLQDATHGMGADACLELSGAADAVKMALRSVRIGGSVVLAGTVAPCASATFDPEAWVRRMITVRGVHNYHPRDLQTAVGALGRLGRRFPLETLIAQEFELERASEALEAAHRAPGSRVAVRP